MPRLPVMMYALPLLSIKLNIRRIGLEDLSPEEESTGRSPRSEGLREVWLDRASNHTLRKGALKHDIIKRQRRDDQKIKVAQNKNRE
jgi:hypothetical protein